MIPRILLWAEPFGLGPSAALAQIALHLKGKAFLGFAGTGHTLDVQHAVGHNTLHSLNHPSELDNLLPLYDCVLVSMDWEVARRLTSQGHKVALFDALTWYWPERPSGIDDLGLYLAQSWPGVSERIETWSLSSAEVIPPLVSLPSPRSSLPRSGTYASLGGIANPLWSRAETLSYAEVMDSALAPLPDLTLGVSALVAASLGPHASTLEWEESRDRFSSARCAVVTPGLGNVLDAAAAGAPTFLLPPANDSQGRQLRSLRQEGWHDASLDWHDLLPLPPLDYQLPQRQVMRSISSRVQALASSPSARQILASRLEEFTSLPPSSSALSGLLSSHGSGGAKMAAEAVLAWAAQLPLHS